MYFWIFRGGLGDARLSQTSSKGKKILTSCQKIGSTISGHVGVVESYNASLDQVTILEAIQNARGENLCPKDCKDNKGNEIVCTFQVRRSIYKRDGKALLQHPGWKGYFRLIEK